MTDETPDEDDEAFLIEGEESEDEEDELSPRELKKIAFKQTLKDLAKLARRLPELPREQQLEAQALFDEAERVGCELSLATFFKMAWSNFDTAPYKHNWHIDVLAEEAEKLITGETRRLIVNVPPRTGKSNLLAIVLPLWIWIQPERGPLSGPQVKIMAGSYGQSLSFEHSSKSRELLMSPWFQKHWGKRFALRDDRNAIGYFENDKGGSRRATSVGAGVTGQGFDLLILDDPHNTQEVESEAERNAVINWYSQSLSTRGNDLTTCAMLLVMQRQQEGDLTGYLLEHEPEMWEHICFRMRYEANPFLPYDIRTEEGELLWPSRVPEWEVIKLEKTLGSYGTSGQLQQRPSPKGGGIIKATDWKLFPPEGQEEEWKKDGVICWPPFETVIASLDGAYTEKEENDPSALTIWGVWIDKTGAPKVVAIHAWEDFLSINKLVMRVGNNCRKFHVDILLIEAKASGISAAQEVQRMFGASDWSTILCGVKGDKVARAISVQGLFEEGQIYAPDRNWAQLLIDRCAQFPKGKRKDLVDSLTQALRWMRDNGLIRRREEHATDAHDALAKPGETVPDLPYDV